MISRNVSPASGRALVVGDDHVRLAAEAQSQQIGCHSSLQRKPPVKCPHARIAVMSLIALCCIWPKAVFAAAVETTGATPCTISGWSDDHDPAGLNICAAPRKDATAIGRIPPPEAQGGDTYAADFEIIGSRDGWLMISGAKFADYGNGKGDRILFPGPAGFSPTKCVFSSMMPIFARLPTQTHQSS
jgi:hypothetical protein